MMSIAWFDDDLDRWVLRGEVDEVVARRGWRLLQVVTNGAGGSAVFAVADAQLLELLDTSCGHICCLCSTG